MDKTYPATIEDDYDLDTYSYTIAGRHCDQDKTHPATVGSYYAQDKTQPAAVRDPYDQTIYNGNVMVISKDQNIGKGCCCRDHPDF